MNPRARAVVVVFDDTVTDTEANMIRNGMQMFAGVRQVIPVRGVPNDLQAAKVVAQHDLTKALRKAEHEREELAACVKAVAEAVASPAPTSTDGVVPLDQRRSS